MALKTRLAELNATAINGYLDTIKFESNYYYPTLFPLQEVPTFEWKTMSMVSGMRIAADIVSRGAIIQDKTREAVNVMRGDIPKIGISRSMDEEALNMYQQLQYMTRGQSNNAALVKFWGDDVSFCATGVASRLEWYALQALSLGKVTIENANNVSVVTEYDVDYQIDNKTGVQNGAWSDADAKPIDDLRYIVKDARSKNIYLADVFMSVNTFSKFASCSQVVKLCASFAANALGIQQIPTIDQVNSALRSLGDLYGLQIHVINQAITLEDAYGNRSTVNPFVDDVCTFVESTNAMGSTFWVRPVEMNLQGSPAIRTMRDCMLIKHWGEENPVREVTQAVANAIPVWAQSQRAYLVDTENSTWTK